MHLMVDDRLAGLQTVRLLRADADGRRPVDDDAAAGPGDDRVGERTTAAKSSRSDDDDDDDHGGGRPPANRWAHVDGCAVPGTAVDCTPVT